ncbi:hypothetical protein N311_07805, partial [Apaloderma vittatum]
VKEVEIQRKVEKLQQSGLVKTGTLAVSAEIHATAENTTLTIVTHPEDVSREGARLQKSMLEQNASEDSTKDPLQPPILREREVVQIMDIPDHHTNQHTSQQTCRESQEGRHHLPVEDGKPQNWEDGSYQDGTSGDSPQSQNSVA